MMAHVAATIMRKSSTRRPTVYGPQMDPACRSASMSLAADRATARQAQRGNSATNALIPITDQPATRQSALTSAMATSLSATAVQAPAIITRNFLRRRRLSAVGSAP